MAFFRPTVCQIAAAGALIGLQGLLPGLAHAQSAYTLSVLNKPSGSDLAVPISMDNQGTVRGGMFYVKRYEISYGEGGCPSLFLVVLCPRHGQREASWAATPNASVTGKAGLTGFFSHMGNDQGSQVGDWEPDRSSRAFTTFLWPNPARIGPGSWLLEGLSRSATFNLLTSQGTQSTVSPIQGTFFLPRAMNNGDAVVGSTGRYGADGAAVWRQGVLTSLPVAFAGPAKANAINDAGVIVGASSASLVADPSTGRPPLRPTRWLGDQPEFLGGPELSNLEAIAVNNAGQVLIAPPSNSSSTASSQVWSQGTLTTLQTLPGQSAHPTAINDQGTVVGCTRVIKDSSALTRADLTATLWRNGVLQDLTQWLTSKGVKLPSGTRLGCPITINQQGSILAYYYKVSSPDTLTWVRINAKP